MNIIIRLSLGIILMLFCTISSTKEELGQELLKYNDLGPFRSIPGVKYYHRVDAINYEKHYASAYLFFDFKTYSNVFNDDQKHSIAKLEMNIWADPNENDLSYKE